MAGSTSWIDLAEDRDQWQTLVGTVMNLRVPLNIGNFMSGLATVGFSIRIRLHGVIRHQQYPDYSAWNVRLTNDELEMVWKVRSWYGPMY
jgi:hypothetical protein